MGLAYENLDESTLRFMREEIEADIANGSIYVSNYLNPRGCDSWPQLLVDAAVSGSDDSLAAAIRSDDCLKSHYDRRKPKGGYTSAAVPYNAHETMGEGEFNRYYCRGLCRRAIEEGVANLEVYRAKARCRAPSRLASQARTVRRSSDSAGGPPPHPGRRTGARPPAGSEFGSNSSHSPVKRHQRRKAYL